jgi:hypothetical protein
MMGVFVSLPQPCGRTITYKVMILKFLIMEIIAIVGGK